MAIGMGTDSGTSVAWTTHTELRDMVTCGRRGCRGGGSGGCLYGLLSDDVALQLLDNLVLYERREASRTPWRPGELQANEGR